MLANKIKFGDTIGIVAPSNYLDEKRKFAIEQAKCFFESKGFFVKEGKHIYDEWYGSAGTPKDRANDINDMFLDDNVSIIICIEGGETCNIVLPYLDFELIRKHPKIIIGYSDVSILLETIYEKTGLVTFHGAEFYEYGIENFQEVLWKNFQEGLMKASNKITLGDDYAVVREGTFSGISIGTNLGCTMNLLGTPYMPSMKEKILFLEAYHIDQKESIRRLEQLRQAGIFEDVNAIVIGYIYAFQKENKYDKSFETIVLEILKDTSVPIIKCNLFGHQIPNQIIPIGVKTEIDTLNGIIEIKETFLN